MGLTKNNMKKQEEKRFNIKEFDQSLVLGFLRQFTDLYDKNKENEFLELLADFITEYDKRIKDEVIEEIEAIVTSGTKVNINYFIDDVLDSEAQEEIFEYFTDAETDDLGKAHVEFDGDYSEEELRLMWIKFMSEMAN